MPERKSSAADPLERLVFVSLRILAWPLTGLLTSALTLGVLAAVGTVAALVWRVRAASEPERALSPAEQLEQQRLPFAKSDARAHAAEKRAEAKAKGYEGEACGTGQVAGGVKWPRAGLRAICMKLLDYFWASSAELTRGVLWRQSHSRRLFFGPLRNASPRRLTPLEPAPILHAGR